MNKNTLPIQFSGQVIKKIDLRNDFYEGVDSPKLKRELDLTFEVVDIDIVDEFYFGTLQLSLSVEIRQSNKKKFRFKLVLEGAFVSPLKYVKDIETFQDYLRISGAPILFANANALLQTIVSQGMYAGRVQLPIPNFDEMSITVPTEDNPN